MDRQLPHPSIEQLGDYARGDLPAAHREQVETHLGECVSCRQRLEEFERFLDDCERPANQDLTEEWRDLRSRIWRHRTSRAVSRWGAVAAIVMVAAGLTWIVIWILTPTPASLLAKAYQQQRGFDFRLAGASYAEVRRQRGGESVFSLPEPLLNAQAQLAEALKSNPDDPELLRLKGEAEMIVGQAAAAVQTLETARDLQPGDARILADLGVAFALRGDLEKQPADYADSLEYLGRSLHLRPQVPEVVFNLALVLERMMLKDQAVEKWEEYLRLDGTSDWSKEARRRLADLKAELKAREDSLSRIIADPAQFLILAATGATVDAEAYLRDIALSRWLPKFKSNGPEKEATLHLARILKERHRDFWLSDIITTTSVSEMPEALEKLGAARSANQGGNADEALAAAREAEQVFLRAGCRAGNLWARYEEVISLHRLLRGVECLVAAERLIADLGSSPYTWLRIQLLIINATYEMRAGRLSEAAPLLVEAGKLGRASGFGEAELRAGINYLDCVRHIGLPSEIYAATHQSLSTFWAGAYPATRFQQIVDRLRSITSRSDMKYAAWFLARSGVWAAESIRDAAVEAPARANLAVAAQAIGNEVEAKHQLDISGPLFGKLPGAYRLEPLIDLAKVELDRGDIDAAINRLEALRGAVDPAPTVLIDTRYFSALGEAYRRKGLTALAIEALRKSIAVGAQRISSLSNNNERAGVLKAIEESYRGLVAATLSLPGAEVEAFRAWQSFRALDAVGKVDTRRTAYPVLSFAELPEGFVGWLSRNERVVFHRLDAAKETIGNVVSRLRRACSNSLRSSPRLADDARQIYQWMIEPFGAELADEDRNLIVELDGVLTGVPLQALISGDQRYLGDRFSVLVSSGYSDRLAAPPVAGSKVLIVANPSLGGQSTTRFPPLPESIVEADVVRSSFTDSTILEGRNATIAAFKSMLGAADVVHFAGHGYSNSQDGALLFAPASSSAVDYELLRSTELRHQDWSRCRLAVLSSCAAAAGEIRGPHNPDSLVRALTRAGASRIAASLWNVDSSATAELIKTFYRALSEGRDPTQALRVAQQAVRKRAEWTHPYFWAGFQLYGTT